MSTDFLAVCGLRRGGGKYEFSLPFLFNQAKNFVGSIDL